MSISLNCKVVWGKGVIMARDLKSFVISGSRKNPIHLFSRCRLHEQWPGRIALVSFLLHLNCFTSHTLYRNYWVLSLWPSFQHERERCGLECGQFSFRCGFRFPCFVRKHDKSLRVRIKVRIKYDWQKKKKTIYRASPYLLFLGYGCLSVWFI